MRSSDCKGNCNSQWNSSLEKSRSKSNNCDNCMNAGGVPQICSGCLLLQMGNIIQMDPLGQMKAPESELSRVELRYSWERARTRGGRDVLHRRGPKSTRIGGSVTS